MGDVTAEEEEEKIPASGSRSNGRIATSEDEGEDGERSNRIRMDLLSNLIMVKPEVVIDPESDVAYMWSTLVSGMILFNLWAIIIRISFLEMRQQFVPQAMFTVMDLATDIIFVLDVVVQLRMGYLEEGIMVKDPMKLAQHYVRDRRTAFVLDVTTALPLANFCLLASGISSRFVAGMALDADSLVPHLLRLPKLVKWHSLSQYIAEWDMKTNNPNNYRAGKLFVYLALTIHWIGCFYKIISEAEGMGSNEWVLKEPSSDVNSPFLRKYLLSIYWSTMTLTTIGNEGNPQTNFEYVFTGCTFLIGVFLFATVVGNVGDVISNMNAARVEFQTKMDSIKLYMKYHRIPGDVQNRIKKWAEYSWNRTQAMDDQTMLDILPFRLRAEIAKHVHLDTLRKHQISYHIQTVGAICRVKSSARNPDIFVKIFEECEQGLLCELVTRLRSQIYSPSDYICRKGEIGREMYIINHGRVEVLIPDSSSEAGATVVATLSEGNYFGEISLLKLEDGCNRRNADVRSVGYSELLVLSKKDLNQALIEYPEARKVLEKQARNRIKMTLKEVSLRVRNSLRAGPAMETRGAEGDRASMKEREMSEVRHIIRELRAFDSMAAKSRQQELENRVKSLEKELREKKRDLQGALSKLTSEETTAEVKVGRGRPPEDKDRRKRKESVNQSEPTSAVAGQESMAKADTATGAKAHTTAEPKALTKTLTKAVGKADTKADSMADTNEKAKAITKLWQTKKMSTKVEQEKKTISKTRQEKGQDVASQRPLTSRTKVKQKANTNTEKNGEIPQNGLSFPTLNGHQSSLVSFPIRIAMDSLSFSKRRLGLCRLVEDSSSKHGPEGEKDTVYDVPIDGSDDEPEPAECVREESESGPESGESYDESEQVDEEDEEEDEEEECDEGEPSRLETVVCGCLRMSGKVVWSESSGLYHVTVLVPAVYVEGVLELASQVREVDLPEGYQPPIGQLDGEPQTGTDQPEETETRVEKVQRVEFVLPEVRVWPPPTEHKFIIPKVVYNLDDDAMKALQGSKGPDEIMTFVTAPDCYHVEGVNIDNGTVDHSLPPTKVIVAQCSESVEKEDTAQEFTTAESGGGHTESLVRKDMELKSSTPDTRSGGGRTESLVKKDMELKSTTTDMGSGSENTDSAKSKDEALKFTTPTTGSVSDCSESAENDDKSLKFTTPTAGSVSDCSESAENDDKSLKFTTPTAGSVSDCSESAENDDKSLTFTTPTTGSVSDCSESAENDDKSLKFTTPTAGSVSDCSESAENDDKSLKFTTPSTGSVSDCSESADNDDKSLKFTTPTTGSVSDCSESADNDDKSLKFPTPNAEAVSDCSESVENDDVAVSAEAASDCSETTKTDLEAEPVPVSRTRSVSSCSSSTDLELDGTGTETWRSRTRSECSDGGGGPDEGTSIGRPQSSVSLSTLDASSDGGLTDMDSDDSGASDSD